MDIPRRPGREKRITIAFRLDDYSALSSTDMELRIIDLFRRNKASVTFGVIPCLCARNVYDPSPQEAICLSTEKKDVLRTASAEGVLDVALHGYSHQTVDTKCYTEFSGLDYHNQLEKIAKGKELLERSADASITTFIPPWNRYDQNTLRALEALGFLTISASLSQAVTADSQLKSLPETCDLVQLCHAVKAARRSAETQPVIVAVFHLFEILEIDNKRGKIAFQGFADLVDWLGSEEDICMMSIRRAATTITDLGAERLLMNKRIRSLMNLLPRPLRPTCQHLYRERT